MLTTLLVTAKKPIYILLAELYDRRGLHLSLYTDELTESVVSDKKVDNRPLAARDLAQWPRGSSLMDEAIYHRLCMDLDVPPMARTSIASVIGASFTYVVQDFMVKVVQSRWRHVSDVPSFWG